jgi:hypothetical protein
MVSTTSGFNPCRQIMVVGVCEVGKVGHGLLHKWLSYSNIYEQVPVMLKVPVRQER